MHDKRPTTASTAPNNQRTDERIDDVGPLTHAAAVGARSTHHVVETSDGEPVLVHCDFIRTDGTITSNLDKIPLLREFIDGTAPTNASFKMREVGHAMGFDSSGGIDAFHVEWAGGWPMPPHYNVNGGNGIRYANPQHVYADSYPEVVVHCDCEATFDTNPDGYKNWVRDVDQHEDGCKPYQRLRARAKLAEERERLIARCGNMGWRVPEIAPRIGMMASAVRSRMTAYGLSATLLRDQYRRKAGNTYVYTVVETDADASLVVDAYGHDRSVLSRWATGYGDYRYNGRAWMYDGDHDADGAAE